jgi:pimeloyl-ACP methyl ester carboxylesterase
LSTDKAGSRRWLDQRWLLDSILRTDGLEWDQPRVAYTVRPMGVDGIADFRVAESRIHKLADMVPVFHDLGARREALAREAEAANQLVTARDHYFLAALLYVTAEWTIWEDTPLLTKLDDRKNECYSAYARLADHHVERIDVPFEDGLIPAWLHLPPGYEGGRLPTVLSCGGMDAPKELNVSLYGDKFLQRGFAVLAFDGPGQGEAAVRGVKFKPTNWTDAGEALMGFLLDRPEVDPDRIVGFGLSFGSYWMTQIGATQPTLKGCAVGLVCHEPGGHMIFEMGSPTFKSRYMWMAGYEYDEAGFDRDIAANLDLTALVAKMEVPWLVVAGDEDELSPVQHSYDLAALSPGPTSLLVYAQGRHALPLPTPSCALGPQWTGFAADWLLDRVTGVPAEERFDYVLPSGQLERRPHPKEARTT